MAENTYRLHWFGGDTQLVRGPDPATAMNNAGIGAGALPALDYYETVASEPDEMDRLRALNTELLTALEILMAEVKAAGLADATDFNWPSAVARARAAIDNGNGEGR